MSSFTRETSLFEECDDLELRPLDFLKVFPDIFKDGGFNAIVGNPPYVLIQDMFRDETLLKYFRASYFSATYKIDLYHLFIEKGIKLLKENGLLGYITPSNYLTNNGLANLRHFILDNTNINELNIIKGKVFKGASVDTTISIFRKTKIYNKTKYILSNWNEQSLNIATATTINQETFRQNTKGLFLLSGKKGNADNLFRLGDLFLVKFGMQLRDRNIFKNDVIKNNETNKITKYHRPCYTGKNINRYQLIYDGLMAYTNPTAKRGGCWDKNVHESNPKILIRQIGESPLCAIDEKGYYCLNTLFMVLPKETSCLYSLYFLLGILNSNYIKYYWKNTFYDMRTTFPKIKGSYLEELFIPKVNFESIDEVNRHDKLVKNVNDLLNTIARLKDANTDNKKEYLIKNCNIIDKQIDQLVYELYGLTEEEIEIVEKSLSL